MSNSHSNSIYRKKDFQAVQAQQDEAAATTREFD
jgi:hypothetical protein